MASIKFTLNQLQYRDPDVARRFEQEIREAAAPAEVDEELECRILAVEGDPEMVRIQFGRPGWVKGSPPIPVQAAEGEVREAARRVLFRS